MKGTFIPGADVEREQLDFGEVAWISRPANTGSDHLTVIDVRLDPGHGHDFHRHPTQDEVITVRAGTIEQWLEQETQVLNVGDSVFIAADTVHASFNTGSEPAELAVVLSPSAGSGGYEVVDVFDEAPWNALRSG